MSAGAIPGLDILGSLLGGLGGLFGGLGTSTVNTTGSTNTSGTQGGSTSSSTTPQLSDLQSLLSSIAGNGAINNYQQGTDLTGYEEGGLQANNQAANSASGQIANRMAATGNEFSPNAVNSESQPILQEQQANSSLVNSLPLLKQQLSQQNLSLLNSIFSSLPTATSSGGTSNLSTTGSSNTQQTQTKPGSILGGLTGLFGGALGGL